MKTVLSILTIIILLVACDNISDSNSFDKINHMSKTSNSVAPFPYLQIFNEIECSWNVDSTNISVCIDKPNIINHSNNYMALIEYSYGNLILYIGDVTKRCFTIPYYGDNNIDNIKLFAIIIHIK